MKTFSARRLDVQAFAEDGGELSGQEPLRAYPRLLAETQGRDPDSPVSWTASAEMRNPRHVHPQVWLHLKAQAQLSLTCQRCLAPVEMPVEVDRSFRFVADEDRAAAEDDQSEEDVLALSRAFDLVELVEDELLMDLPLAPRHDNCPPVSVKLGEEDLDAAGPERENPFAVLGKLKPPPK
ncbi:YceD family protein [Ramlibacter tataouinensis]|uniref:Large ribosomal RNA subunit accumulation protein YceD n=1 Tax=Ramlibacter tataouinensis TaxID=94132 RepID=A0A127JQC3_9BURK|nr:DUF177 domain-containing protein [Ramlibacter tataouinensis]AMO22115.1 hypothetical protein UC35_03485 [Ramlibacter tataouinensis]